MCGRAEAATQKSPKYPEGEQREGGEDSGLWLCVSDWNLD